MNVHSLDIDMPEIDAAQDKRQCILQAALRLLAAKGFHGFSMKQLALEAGVATGTVYLYFQDKQDLIEQLHMQIMRIIADATLVGLNPSASPRQKYHVITHNFWHFCSTNPDILMSKGQFDHLPSDVLRTQYSAALQLFQPLMDLFEQGRQLGNLKNFDDQVLLCLVLDPFLTLARKSHLGMVEVNAELLEQFIDASWDAVVAR